MHNGILSLFLAATGDVHPFPLHGGFLNNIKDISSLGTAPFNMYYIYMLYTCGRWLLLALVSYVLASLQHFPG